MQSIKLHNSAPTPRHHKRELLAGNQNKEIFSRQKVNRWSNGGMPTFYETRDQKCANGQI